MTLKLELHADEVTTVPPPAPLFVMAPRLGYLPQVSSQALQHFASVLPPGENQPWFEYQGVPLKWHIPTGALYDLLSEGEYPWCLTMHFRAYPSDVLQPLATSTSTETLVEKGEDLASTDIAMQASYLNSLKEAAYVLTGNSNAVMSLTKKSQQELWTNVLEAKSRDFYNNIGKMDLNKPLRSRIPVRIYAREKIFDSFTGWKSIDYASKALHIGEDTDKDELTAKHLVVNTMEHLNEADLENVKVVAAGVQVSLDSNIAEVYSHLKNADMWLYLCILLQKSQKD